MNCNIILLFSQSQGEEEKQHDVRQEYRFDHNLGHINGIALPLVKTMFYCKKESHQKRELS